MEENEWTTLRLLRDTKDRLAKLKVHHKQSYDEVTQELLKKVEWNKRIKQEIHKKLESLRKSETDRDKIIPRWRNWLEEILPEPNPKETTPQ